jgi:hypothetical protein
MSIRIGALHSVRIRIRRLTILSQIRRSQCHPKFQLTLELSGLVARICYASMHKQSGPVAQRLEQGTHNPLVPGSNPGGPTPETVSGLLRNRPRQAHASRQKRITSTIKALFSIILACAVSVGTIEAGPVRTAKNVAKSSAHTAKNVGHSVVKGTRRAVHTVVNTFTP